ncbi:SSI family serine proteinase inhibitor [Saccharopolyspora sp. NPDC049357]|uniref:SSI family serine proteinase inhibitor n=1 Tax=Saccharopolyspora sp. NPDC049357 TaxID=3154507 RepID=UPI00343D352E
MFMNQIRLARLVGGVAALVTVVLLPVGAHAAPDDSSQSRFTLTITENQQSRGVVLECDPTGGDHPRAFAACDELKAADGRFQDLDAESSSSKSCTKERRSVSASVQGFWKDRQVSYQSSNINLCELQRSTGSVFAF